MQDGGMGWNLAMNKEVSAEFKGQEQNRTNNIMIHYVLLTKRKRNAFVAGLCAFLQEKDALLACENHCHHF